MNDGGGGKVNCKSFFGRSGRVGVMTHERKWLRDCSGKGTMSVESDGCEGNDLSGKVIAQ